MSVLVGLRRRGPGIGQDEPDLGAAAGESKPAPFLDASAWIGLGWAFLVAQLVGCGLLVQAGDLGGGAVLAAFAALTAIGLHWSARVPAFFALGFSIAAMGNAAGWVWGLYDRLWWLDAVLHFLTPFALVGGLLSAALRLRLIAFPNSRSTLILRCAAAGLLLGLAWEGLEALFLNLGFADTLTDLGLDVLGGAVAGWLVWRLPLQSGEADGSRPGLA